MARNGTFFGKAQGTGLHRAMQAKARGEARTARLMQDFSEPPLSGYDAITQMELRANCAGYRL